ncbi:hypothetical protein [Hafnia paralvei]|nr:hypothetical protein [Hafnia paralvei]
MAHSAYLWVDGQSGVDAPGWSFFHCQDAVLGCSAAINAVYWMAA